MKQGIVITGIFIFCWMLSGCHHNSSVQDIKAEYFMISYGESMYDALNKVEAETVDMLVNYYNEIELISPTTEEINYTKAITITFVYDDQISGQITLDDKGVCQLNDNAENYLIREDSEIYGNALMVYDELKKKYE